MFYLSLLVGIGLNCFQTFGSLSPFGVEMCKLKCKTTVGCKRIVFQVKDLGCCVQDGRINMSGCFDNTNGNADVMEVLPRSTHEIECDKGLRVINTRTHNSSCERTRAEVQCRNSDFKTRNYTALIDDAFYNREFKVIRCLLALSLIDVNMTKLTKGRTPVMLAALCGNKALFDYIIELHCDLSTRDSLGRSVMHMACSGGHLQIVKVLVEEKAMDVDVRDNLGGTPIMAAAYYDQVDVCVYLIKHGCNMLAVNKYNLTVLDYACEGDAINVLRQLIDVFKLPIDKKGFVGRTPFLTSAYYGSSSIVDILADRNCNVVAVDDEGNNALHLATSRGHSHLVEKLLQTMKLDINARCERGLTSIAISTKGGYIDTCKVLLKNGADPLLKDDAGFNALHYAAFAGRAGIAEQIISKVPKSINKLANDGRTGVMIAAVYGQFNVLKLLVENGADISGTDVGNNNIYHLACVGGDNQIKQMLTKMRKKNIGCD